MYVYEEVYKCIKIGPSEVRALPLGIADELSVHYFWDYFSSFFLFFQVTYFSPRRGCPRILNFWMDPWLT